MKRILYILPAIVILAACNKETAPVPADSDEPVIRTISLTVGADNGASKATYADNTLAAMWEDGDQILALKGAHSESATSTDNACPLGMISEPGGKEAKFSSESFPTSTGADVTAYWYFAYPADAAAMSASVTRTWEWEYKYAYSNTVSVTIPGTQTGLKWIPYMFASTDDKLTDNARKEIAFQTLSACLAIKLMAAGDGNIPQKVKSVKIESDQNNLYGTFSRTVNDLDTKITLDETFYTGAGNTFLAEYDGGGTDCKEFRFNIPAKIYSGNLTVTIVDDEDRSVTRTASNKAVDPGHKRNLKFAWEPESSFVDVTFNEVTANTTYSYYKAGNPGEANKMENRLKAICTADVTIDGVDNPDVSYKFSVDNADPVDADSDFNHEFSNLTVGSHSLVAIAVVNGITYKSDPVSFYITGLPYSVNNFENEAENWDASNGSIAFKTDGIYLYTPTGAPKCTYKNKFSFPESTNVSLNCTLSKPGSAIGSYETYAQFGSIKATTGSNKTKIDKKAYSNGGSVQGDTNLAVGCSYGLANYTSDYAVNAIEIRYK